MNNATVCRDIDTEELTIDKNKEKVRPRVHLAEVAIGGFAAAFGMAEGPAVFVTDPGDPSSLAGIPQGAIVVSQTAHPNLTMIIPRAGALVVENGGMLSVPADAARVHAIPAVMGATGLGDMISQGDIIRVDGRNGIVKVIRKR